jgi:antitoxin VapB
MSIGTVFVNNRTQAVRLPLDVRLPEGVQKVEIRAKGKERIIAPPRPNLGHLLFGRPHSERRLLARARHPASVGAESALMLRYLLDTNIVIA